MADFTISQDPLLTLSPQLPAGISQAHVDAPYLAYSIQTRYVFASGKVQAPVAAASGDARNVQLHAPAMLKTVTWSATRRGAAPALPLPEPATGNETLLGAEIIPDAPVLDSDGVTHIYTVSGTYTFSLSVPIWYTEGLPMGALPPTTDVAQNNVVAPAQFQSGILS